MNETLKNGLLVTGGVVLAKTLLKDVSVPGLGGVRKRKKATSKRKSTKLRTSKKRK